MEWRNLGVGGGKTTFQADKSLFRLDRVLGYGEYMKNTYKAKWGFSTMLNRVFHVFSSHAARAKSSSSLQLWAMKFLSVTMEGGTVKLAK